MYEDDFTFYVNRNRPPTTRFRFLTEKKTVRVEDDFNCNVVLHPNDLTQFFKKKIDIPIFTNFSLNESWNIKKS